jgi:hypothetical protein
MKVFENRVLRRIFGPKRDEIIGGRIKLYNEELHNLYTSSNIIRMIKSKRMKWTRSIARMGDKQNTHKVLVGKPVGKRPLGRPRSRWEDDTKMDLREIGWNDMDWIHVGSVEGYFEHGNELPHFMKYWAASQDGLSSMEVVRVSEFGLDSSGLEKWSMN